MVSKIHHHHFSLIAAVVVVVAAVWVHACVCAFAMMTLTLCLNETKSSSQAHGISRFSFATVVFLVCIGLLYIYRFIRAHGNVAVRWALLTVHRSLCECVCYCQAGKFSRFFCFCHDLYCGFFVKRITHIPCVCFQTFFASCPMLCVFFRCFW